MPKFRSYQEAVEHKIEQDIEDYYNEEEITEEDRDDIDSDERYEEYRDDMIRKENGW